MNVLKSIAHDSVILWTSRIFLLTKRKPKPHQLQIPQKMICIVSSGIAQSAENNDRIATVIFDRVSNGKLTVGAILIDLWHKFNVQTRKIVELDRIQIAQQQLGINLSVELIIDQLKDLHAAISTDQHGFIISRFDPVLVKADVLMVIKSVEKNIGGHSDA